MGTEDGQVKKLVVAVWALILVVCVLGGGFLVLDHLDVIRETLSAHGMDRVLPEAPISVVQRDSAIGRGKVLILTNTSGDYLHECTIKIVARDGNQTCGPMTFSTSFAPHEQIEIGWAELETERSSWIVEPGEMVTLRCKGYGPAIWTVGE